MKEAQRTRSWDFSGFHGSQENWPGPSVSCWGEDVSAFPDVSEEPVLPSEWLLAKVCAK